MASQFSLIVTQADAGMRLDSLLAVSGAYPSRSAAVKQIEAGKVLVNGLARSKRSIVAPGDTIVYEEIPLATHIPLRGEPIPLDVRFEDRWMMAISKQAGLCVHPAPGHEGGTLVNALIYAYGRDSLAHVQGDDRPGIVHRLDMDTSGLMMCAKDDTCGMALQDLVRDHKVDRRYLTLVHGNIAFDTGQIDEPIGRVGDDRLRMKISYRPTARNALTTFTVLERFEAGRADNGYTLLECRLYTGRTHQIRVHMEFIGHCCVGDPLYRWGNEQVNLELSRQFLHSYSLSFNHPMTGDDIALVDGLPPDLFGALRSLEDRSMGRTEAGKRIFATLATAPRQSEELQAHYF
ncbi:pseudouridine synthase, RluA family [Cryptobacterium curtum DSM 15641]|uniref:Pseudouridine synthase n=1 Tax=Cryptobacterium curtum (strain ATCC 700683 / DSM 15641 / CCUG 43107 / 12-3) TaxID=469378 RepID=C7MN62_CRYCD|nr:RluA family pseudouridine synthase [Cryptobacterium curtum]ACU94352.1 pseudouridine synthase, RluA family [Cryptobacterium curtum DSM 15641]